MYFIHAAAMEISHAGCGGPSVPQVIILCLFY
jgi:hypothetical protein